MYDLEAFSPADLIVEQVKSATKVVLAEDANDVIWVGIRKRNLRPFYELREVVYEGCFDFIFFM